MRNKTEIDADNEMRTRTIVENLEWLLEGPPITAAQFNTIIREAISELKKTD